MSDRVLSRGRCSHCRKPVIWGLLQNGRRRTFEPEPQPVETVVERDRFHVSRRLGRVVDLVGVANPPSVVLVAHYCREYADAKRLRNVARLDDAFDTVVDRLVRGSQ